MLRSRCVGLSGKARQHRTAALVAPDVVPQIRDTIMTVATRIDRVNILLVDDQPSKLMTYESILADSARTSSR